MRDDTRPVSEINIITFFFDTDCQTRPAGIDQLCGMQGLIDKKYLPVTVFKNDPKGRVIKCLDISRPLHIRWVLLKEGKNGACMDEAGRDIRDRLRWQHDVQNEPQVSGLVPHAYEFFEWGQDGYLAMEYVEGVSLHEVINTIYCGRPLCLVPKKGRERLISLFLEVLCLTERLHAAGYIHRDLTPHNFLFDSNNRLLFVDMELAYSVTQQSPLPPYALGSPGYMSPQQLAVQAPSLAEDVYGLGAMMIRFFTGLAPVKFERKDLSRLCKSLEFFTGNKKLSEIITQCLDNNPANRPILHQIRSTVAVLKSFGIGAMPQIPAAYLIERSLKTLESTRFTNENCKWRLAEEVGVLYLRAVAGISRPGLIMYIDMPPALLGGLLQGAWGLAVATAVGVKSRLLPDNETSRSFIRECLSAQASGFNVSEGAAGQGIAVLYCRPLLDKMFIDKLLANIVSALLKQYKHIKVPGLFYGKAGIAWFLFAYSEKYTNEKAFAAAEDLLRSLLEQKTVLRLSPWLGEGFAGLALLCIKAFELTKDKKYKAQAERLLMLHPPKIVSDTFGFGDGLTGLGEVYLEAHRVLGGTCWNERAGWIAAVLAHTYYQQQDGGVYWLTGHSLTPTADLTTGNAGIIHFLLRYHNSNIQFPLFNNGL